SNMVGQGDPERVDGARLMFDMLPMLGARPLIGRVFSEADDKPGTTRTVILSYGLWQNSFGGDAGIVGRSVNLDGVPSTSIGVLPASFNFPNRQIRFWMPFQFGEDAYQDRGDDWIHVIGRMKPGVTLGQVRADLALVKTQLVRQFPQEAERDLPPPYLLQDDLSTQSRLLLQTLVGAALCILL